MIERRLGGLLLAAAVVLGGCGTSSDSGSASDVTLPPSEGATSESASPGGPQEGDPSVNERGNIEVAVGEEIPLPDGGTFVIDALESVPLPCPTDNEFQESVPQNAQFIRLNIRAATAPASAGTAQQASISSFNFRMIQSNGVTFNTDMGTFPAFSCLPQEEQFPSGGLGPGQQFVGSIVLDVPDPQGTLVFSPSGGWVPGETGYEFQL
jgi:hypothetical protein